MYIEDLIIIAAVNVKLNPFDSKLIWSFYDQFAKGVGFTEKQSNLAIRTLSKHTVALSQFTGKDINAILATPTFKFAKRTINPAKKISIIAHPSFVKAIKLEFPYNEAIVEKIRKARSSVPNSVWDSNEKAWIFALTEAAIQLLIPFVHTDEFIPDAEFLGYMEQIKNIQETLENHVPMVRYSNNSLEFANISANVPQLTTNDIVESLFLARQVGIHTWDDYISQYLATTDITQPVVEFLNQNPGSNFTVNLEENPISAISDIVKNLSPCLFIIPGGLEMEKTYLSLALLKSAGVREQEISVLFRLSKDIGENFNKFVKDERLNNPISDTTKAIFISGKIPKTVIESGIKFNCIINFSIHSVHYTIRDFVKNHHNVIHVLDKKPQRNFNFAIL